MPTEDFDPYYKWLGIPPEEQPPHHYRLLGIRALEVDGDVIAHAADRQMAHVRTFQNGPHAEVSQRLLNEISAARLCLHTPESKAEYDAALKDALKDAIGAAREDLIGAVPPLPLVLAAQQAQPSPREIVVPGEFTVAATDCPSNSDANGVPRRGWGWKAIVGALCIALAAVGVAWKIRTDRRAADAEPDGDKSVQTDHPDGKTNPAGDPELRTEPANGGAAASSAGGSSAEQAVLPELEGAVDLLADVDVMQHAVQGDWHREGPVLVSPAGKNPTYAILKLPGPVPAEYTLALLVERVEGRDALAINFPIGENSDTARNRGVIVLDSTVGGLFADSPVSGLDRIDGRQCYQNETKRIGRVFPRRRAYAVVCEVRRTGVRVTVDGKEILNWQGEPFRLSVGRQWQAKEAPGIVLGSYRSAYRFLKVVVAPLMTNDE